MVAKSAKTCQIRFEARFLGEPSGCCIGASWRSLGCTDIDEFKLCRLLQGDFQSRCRERGEGRLCQVSAPAVRTGQATTNPAGSATSTSQPPRGFWSVGFRHTRRLTQTNPSTTPDGTFVFIWVPLGSFGQSVPMRSPSFRHGFHQALICTGAYFAYQTAPWQSPARPR